MQQGGIELHPSLLPQGCGEFRLRSLKTIVSAFLYCLAPGVSPSSCFSPQDKGKERLFPVALQRFSEDCRMQVMQLLPHDAANLSCVPFRRLALFYTVQLRLPDARVISHFGCAAKGAASPNRLVPVASKRSSLLFYTV
ncbi:hypothetical protein GGGNBK_07640 [Sporosarcina sp. ANT_H38]